MKSLVSAALFLTASGALADSPLPPANVPSGEIVIRTPAEAPSADEQLRKLTLEIQSLNAEIQQLRAIETQRAAHQAELHDQSDLKLWP